MLSMHQSSLTLSLLDRLRSRNSDGWSRLVCLFSPIVYHWARRAGLQDADAGDVVQDVFAAVHVSIDMFRREKHDDSFRGWLYRITHFKVQDVYRRRERFPPGEGGSVALRLLNELPQKTESEEDAETTSMHLARRGLELIQGDFEPRTWQAFQRFAVQGSPAEEVASELGLSVGAVYVAKSRVLKRLREELDGLI